MNERTIRELSFSNSGRRLTILVNGPSLLKYFDSHNDLLRKNEKVLCVNEFCCSDYFTWVKPDYYLIQDPLYWGKARHESFKKKSIGVAEALNKNVFWSMKFFVPVSASKNNLLVESIDNDNIEFIYYNDRCLPSLKLNIYLMDSWLNGLVSWLWYKNFLAPPPMNVLGGALYLSSILGAQKIRIFGANMDHFKYIQVAHRSGITSTMRYFDESRNIIAEKNEKNEKNETGNPILAIELRRWANLFDYFEMIAKYLKHRKIIVRNCSEGSMIEAFEIESSL